MKTVWLKFVLLIWIIAALIPVIHCIPIGDSAIYVQGKVYEWIDAPENATSRIYIVSVIKYYDAIQELEKLIENINKDMTVVPVKDASIKIGEEKEFRNSDCRSCVIKETSDENGDFEGIEPLPAFTFEYQVRVTCPGYVDVAGELENGEKTNHVIVAVLFERSQ